MIKEVGLARIVKYFFTELWYVIFLLLPYSPLRVFWLRLGGAKIGKNCFIERIFLMNLDRTGLSGLTMGNDCYLGAVVLLDLAGKISLGNQVTVTARSSILSHHSVGYSNHPLIKFYPKKVLHTRLESGVVLGVASLILPGVTIGKESLVAAGAVVRNNVPIKVMVAGIPAQVKKKLS
jgi:acetyltransferase-like isoleucine patch superfamily enzyme